MWIDSHCHLDAEEFDTDREQVVERAQAAGVQMMLIPAVEVSEFERLRGVAHRFGFGYTLGIHPLYVAQAGETDLGRLSEAVRTARVDPNFVGIGEIGLDFHEGAPDAGRQEHFYQAQLPRIAAVIAQLRSISPEQLAQINRRNVLDAFPRLAALSRAA